MNEIHQGTNNENISQNAANPQQSQFDDMTTNMPSPPQLVNPLLQYYRQPKIYLQLPSKGRFYPNGALDCSETGDYAVFSMTAKDELMFKTPDALMNGQSTVEVIKSCIPAIKNPWQMPSIDLDAALIAIRVATYGDSMGITTKCPECNEENDYDINLIAYLENLALYEYKDVINIDPLTVYIQPYSYKEVTKAAIKALEQEKIFTIVNDENLSDEEKLEQFGHSFVKLTSLSVDIIADSIVKIVTPEGEVTDHKLIMDFINNAPKEIFKNIKLHIDELKNKVEIKSHAVVCSECKHQFETTVTMDQSNFFDVKS